MLNLLSEDMRRNPYPFYEAARGSTPLVHMPDPGMYFVFDYEGVKRALTDSENFSSIATPPTGRAGSANRDAKVFPEPDRFDAGRGPPPHLGFGHGIHYCIGAALSRLESRVALADLLTLEDFQLASAEPWTPRIGLHLHGPARLPVRFKPCARVSAA